MVDSLKSIQFGLEYCTSKWSSWMKKATKPSRELLQITPNGEPVNKEQASLFPNEIIVKFLEECALVVDPQRLDKEALRPLLRMAQVSIDCYNLVDQCLQKIYAKELGSYKPEGISWAQALSLLYNWQQQAEKGTYLTTAKEVQGSFSPVNCHLPVKEPALMDDQVEIEGTRLSLAKNLLIAGVNEETPDGKVKFKVLWRHPIRNQDKHLFISVDKALVATQHLLVENKEGQERPVCRFDVRSVKTGHLIGSIILFPEEGKKRFESTDIEFSLKQFAYQKKGKLWVRDYQESSQNNCLMLKA